MVRSSRPYGSAPRSVSVQVTDIATELPPSLTTIALPAPAVADSGTPSGCPLADDDRYQPSLPCRVMVAVAPATVALSALTGEAAVPSSQAGLVRLAASERMASSPGLSP